MDRKPAQRTIANQAGNDLAIGISNVDVQRGPLKISEVSGVEIAQSTSNRIATLRLNRLHHLEIEGSHG
jgi:predicted HTH transcriptional regulator